ncbi:MAG: hypothetical protein WCK85_11630 [Chlorobium sp.]
MIPLHGENRANDPAGYLCGFETLSIMPPCTIVKIEIMEVTIYSHDKHLGMIPERVENRANLSGNLCDFETFPIMLNLQQKNGHIKKP